MKKTYNAPEMTVVEIQTAAGMLAGSPTMNLNSDETVDGSSALSRKSRVSSWDDDEDD